MAGWIGRWLGLTDVNIASDEKEKETLNLDDHSWSLKSSRYELNIMTCAATTGYPYISTGVPMMSPMFRSYVEKEVEDPGCEYCGNLSKLRDPRGNCIACGGPRR